MGSPPPPHLSPVNSLGSTQLPRPPGTSTCLATPRLPAPCPGFLWRLRCSTCTMTVDWWGRGQGAGSHDLNLTLRSKEGLRPSHLTSTVALQRDSQAGNLGKAQNLHTHTHTTAQRAWGELQPSHGDLQESRVPCEQVDRTVVPRGMRHEAGTSRGGVNATVV